MTPTAEIRDLQARLRAFIDEWVVPVERTILAPSSADELAALTRAAKQQGLWALGHPAELGGAGLGFIDYVHVNEVIGRSPAAAVALGTHTLHDAVMLHRHGTDAQRERWLAPLVEGELFVGLAMTEPEVSGSDPTMIRTTAVPDGDGWVLDGHKWFTSWADRAELLVVVAKTDPNAQLHDQFSAFLVPTDTPGCVRERLIGVMGDTDSIYGEFRLDRVELDADAMLGARGAGFRLVQARLRPARIVDVMGWIGQAERAFDMMCEFARTRWAHGSPLAHKGEVQRYIAESAAQIHATRLLALDAAAVLDAGHEARLQISMAKFVGSRMLHDVLDRAIQVHGALGVSSDLPLEWFYRQARSTRLYDGSDEVHRMVVARALADDPSAAPWHVPAEGEGD